MDCSWPWPATCAWPPSTLAPFSFALLVSTLGVVRAREILLTARLVDAPEARTLGLVEEVHPSSQLLPRVRAVATSMAEHAPLTMAAVKEATRRVREQLVIADADDLILSCYLSQDFREGVRAFLEKRKANWQGR